MSNNYIIHTYNCNRPRISSMLVFCFWLEFTTQFLNCTDKRRCVNILMQNLLISSIWIRIILFFVYFPYCSGRSLQTQTDLDFTPWAKTDPDTCSTYPDAEQKPRIKDRYRPARKDTVTKQGFISKVDNLDGMAMLVFFSRRNIHPQSRWQVDEWRETLADRWRGRTNQSSCLDVWQSVKSKYFEMIQ